MLLSVFRPNLFTELLVFSIHEEVMCVEKELLLLIEMVQ